MKSRQRRLRMIFSGALFAATLACGVYAYRAETQKSAEIRQEAARQEEELQELTENANTNNAKADMAGETPVTTPDAGETEKQNTEENNTGNTGTSGEENAAATGTTSENTEQSESTEQPENTEQPTATEQPADTETPADEDAETTASGAVLPTLDFNEGTVLNMPAVGQTVIPYSMDGTVYFPTLDQYRYSPAVVIAAETHAPVVAAANSQVVSIEENAVTGTTVTMDMGNGFQAVYGQLTDLAVTPGQIVESGTIIGTVNDPTKYYTKEGSNLYFAMTKDGTPLDPALYLPSAEE